MCGDFRRLDRVAVLARLRDELKSLSNSVTAKLRTKTEVSK
jgi:hypothetical protein